MYYKLYTYILLSSIFLFNTINCFTYHLEKAYGGIWGNNGQAIKYFSNWRLLSNKITDKGGAMTMLDRLKSNGNWEIVLNIHMSGNFAAEGDGVVIWLSKTAPMKEFNPNISMESQNFGFTDDFKGHYILIKAEKVL